VGIFTAVPPQYLPPLHLPPLHLPLMPYPAQLLADIEECCQPERQSGTQSDIAGVPVMLEGESSHAPGIGAGETRHRKRSASVIASIGEGLQQRVPNLGAKSVTLTRLVFGAPVHESGETVVDAHLHRGLRCPLGDPTGEVVGTTGLVAELVDQSTADDADEGAGTGEIVEVIVQPDILRVDPKGPGSPTDSRARRRRRLGRGFTGNCYHRRRRHTASHRTATY
jgi:hypothetical protein